MSRRTVFLTLVVSSLVTLPVHAAVEIYSRVHDNGGAGYGPLLGPQFGVFNEPQFNDFGGARTLQKVTLSVRIDSTGGSAEFDNRAPGGMITLTIGSFVDVMGPDPIPGAPLIVNANAVNSLTGFVGAHEGDIPPNYSGPDYLRLNGTSSTDIDTESYTTAPELAPYIGAGLVAFNWDGGRSNTGTVLTAGGDYRVDFHSLHNYKFTTTLTYEYVPEPSGLMMLLLSGGALLLRWRK